MLKWIFTEARQEACNRKDGLRMTASECLTLYPLLRRIAECHEHMPNMYGACQSLYALCDVCDAMQAAKRGAYTSVEEHGLRMKDLVTKYMTIAKAVYGLTLFRPKHHQLLHLARQFLLDKRLQDCFPMERMHKASHGFKTTRRDE